MAIVFQDTFQGVGTLDGHVPEIGDAWQPEGAWVCLGDISSAPGGGGILGTITDAIIPIGTTVITDSIFNYDHYIEVVCSSVLLTGQGSYEVDIRPINTSLADNTLRGNFWFFLSEEMEAVWGAYVKSPDWDYPLNDYVVYENATYTDDFTNTDPTPATPLVVDPSAPFTVRWELRQVTPGDTSVWDVLCFVNASQVYHAVLDYVTAPDRWAIYTTAADSVDSAIIRSIEIGTFADPAPQIVTSYGYAEATITFE